MFTSMRRACKQSPSCSKLKKRASFARRNMTTTAKKVEWWDVEYISISIFVYYTIIIIYIIIQFIKQTMSRKILPGKKPLGKLPLINVSPENYPQNFPTKKNAPGKSTFLPKHWLTNFLFVFDILLQWQMFIFKFQRRPVDLCNAYSESPSEISSQFLAIN